MNRHEADTAYLTQPPPRSTMPDYSGNPMNLRTTGIVVLVVLLIALLASTIHYAGKAKDAEVKLKAAESSAQASAAAADANASKLVEQSASSRAEIETHRSKHERLSKENAELQRQADAGAKAADMHRKTQAELSATRESTEQLKAERDELKRQAAQARAEADAERAARAGALAASDARPAPTMASRNSASNEPVGPSIYWMDKPWYPNLELMNTMWLYRNPAKTDAQQQIEYREAEAELRRRGALK
jgi:multidrug efflux pump subunit AcrA (membrane-fusion protein)